MNADTNDPPTRPTQECRNCQSCQPATGKRQLPFAVHAKCKATNRQFVRQNQPLRQGVCTFHIHLPPLTRKSTYSSSMDRLKTQEAHGIQACLLLGAGPRPFWTFHGKKAGAHYAQQLQQEERQEQCSCHSHLRLHSGQAHCAGSGILSTLRLLRALIFSDRHSNRRLPAET